MNPDTLTPEWVDAIVIAGKRANKLGVPIVYDPVGVGATKYRNEIGARFLEMLRLAVVHGNSGEVARNLAEKHRTVVAMTGKRVMGVDNGHVMLTTITEMGCMATTMIGMFCAVESDCLPRLPRWHVTDLPRSAPHVAPKHLALFAQC